MAKSVSKHHIDAMAAMFELAKAIEDGLLSIDDLADMIRMSTESGHEMLSICLAMASVAASMVADEREV